MGWTDDSDAEEEEIEEETEDETEEVSETEETIETEEDTMSDDTNDVDLSELAPNAMDVDEASESDHQYKMMVWANEGQGKTHAGYTMPEPVCFIDTEHKADDIAHKFDDKTVQIWQPSNFDEAVENLEEALNFLSEYFAQTGKRGTIVVDSMADMWEWSQYKYIEDWYPNSAPDEVNLDLQDWSKVKDYHNKKFRRLMENCDFNVYWTTSRKDDVGAAIENDTDVTPDKPGGESNNPYKVNSIIRLYLNDEGIPVGDLQKSGLVRFKYIGLERPTFPKHKEIVERVEEIEAEGVDDPREVEDRFDLDYDVRFTEANTMRFIE